MYFWSYLRSSQPPEDEVLLQYLVVGICKSAAVLGMVNISPLVTPPEERIFAS